MEKGTEKRANDDDDLLITFTAEQSELAKEVGLSEGDMILVRPIGDVDVEGKVVMGLLNGVKAFIREYHRNGDLVELKPMAPGVEAIVAPAEAVVVVYLVLSKIRNFRRIPAGEWSADDDKKCQPQSVDEVMATIGIGAEASSLLPITAIHSNLGQHRHF